MSVPRARIAYLTFSSGTFDARTFRMARTARAAGYDVTVYARWHAGLPPEEERDGVRIVRAPFSWRLGVPFLRERARQKAERAMAAAANPGQRSGRVATRRPILMPLARWLFRTLVPRGIKERIRKRWRMLKMFPVNGLGWAAALEGTAEPADIWHGMWAGSLPALTRLRRDLGGRSIYDSRDVYMHSRDFARTGQPWRFILSWLERRWARSADRVITVNKAYAGLLARQFRIKPPAVVMNLPYRWRGRRRELNLIRDALALPEETAIVLYQGGLMTDRGIEQAMDAILDVPNAVLCLLGFGPMRDVLIDRTAIAPYAGRVYVLDPVPPDRLLEWTASADVSVMAIQPTSTNHSFTTPQKLFESIAVGVPVVASNLPGMAEVVEAIDAGALCDPTDPADIARAIREVLNVSPAVRQARRSRILEAAKQRYNWEAETPTLLAIYAELLSTGVPVPAAGIVAPAPEEPVEPLPVPAERDAEALVAARSSTDL